MSMHTNYKKTIKFLVQQKHFDFSCYDSENESQLDQTIPKQTIFYFAFNIIICSCSGFQLRHSLTVGILRQFSSVQFVFNKSTSYQHIPSSKLTTTLFTKPRDKTKKNLKLDPVNHSKNLKSFRVKMIQCQIKHPISI